MKSRKACIWYGQLSTLLRFVLLFSSFCLSLVLSLLLNSRDMLSWGISLRWWPTKPTGQNSTSLLPCVGRIWSEVYGLVPVFKKFPAGFCPWAAKRSGYDLGGCPRGRFDLLFAIYDVPPFYRPSAIFCVFIVHQELCTIITSQHQKLWWLGEGPKKGA